MSLLGRVILSRFRFPNLVGGLRKYSVLGVNQPVVSTFPCSINRLQNVQPLQLTTNQSLLSVASNLIPSLGLRYIVYNSDGLVRISAYSFSHVN